MKNERGFSLIELLIVVVIIGVVATLAVPALQKGIMAAENGNTYATLRSMSTTQMSFYSQNSRYARLGELNAVMSSALGTSTANELQRGKFTFVMEPATPTDPELHDGYTIVATRNVPSEGVIYKYRITQDGYIQPVLP